MNPRILEKRDADPDAQGEDDKRTRFDDTDPDIVFSPGSSPYQDQQQSAWTVVKDPSAFNGSAVMTNRIDASLRFGFPGDSLTLGLLYKGVGTSLKVTLEDGFPFTFQVFPADAAASAPNGNMDTLQKKVFRITGLSCTNHTATVTPSALPDGRPGSPAEASLIFDWYSIPSPDDLVACAANSIPSTPPSPGPTPSVEKSGQADDTTMLYAGIGAGAAVFGFILALVVLSFCRRRRLKQRRQASTMDPDDRSYRPGRKLTSDSTVSTLLNMSPDSRKSTAEPEPVFRPRGLHALAQDESFAHSQVAAPPSTMESASTLAAFPLMPITRGEYPRPSEDAGFGIGSALLGLQQRPASLIREPRNSGTRFHYEKARESLLPSDNRPQRDLDRGVSTLVGGYALERMPKVESATCVATKSDDASAATKSLSQSKSPRRPKTTSAVHRLRAQAHQLDIQRPLSPFDRSRPTTSSDSTIRHHQSTMQPRLATAPAHSTNRFRRNSIGSGDTHWSRASADASALESRSEAKRSDGQLDIPKSEKTTDSEAEMWISKAKILEQKRRNSIGATSVPQRPPKSPHRPSTGHGAPPTISFQPFMIR